MYEHLGVATKKRLPKPRETKPFEHVGAYLKSLREEREMTQDEVAREIEIPATYISLWESGKRLPETTNLERLSRFYGQTMNAILAGGATFHSEADVQASDLRGLLSDEDLADLSSKDRHHWAHIFADKDVDPTLAKVVIAAVQRAAKKRSDDE